MNYGSVFLSWDRVLSEARDPSLGHNLVIHEFAHQLDFLDGFTNGVPALRSREQTQRWQRVMQGAYQRLRHALQEGHKTFLGQYAATNPTEFFSVASEKFFTLPSALRENHPDLFDVLAEYYRVDPLRWFQANAGETSALTNRSQAVPLETKANENENLEALGDSDFIDFTCPFCGNPISFPKHEAGHLRQCPNCLESMLVPESSKNLPERFPFPLQTERLLLRRFRDLDSEDLVGVLENESNLRYTAWEPISLERAQEWIANESQSPFPKASESHCCIALEAVEPGKVIGLATFEFFPEDFDLARIELIINSKWQRKGYGLEAVRALLQIAFKGFRAHRLIAGCDARNTPGLALLHKAGLRREGEALEDQFVKDQWITTIRFAILQREFLAQIRNARESSGI